MTIGALSPVAGLSSVVPEASAGAGATGNFLDVVNSALQNVSSVQNDASKAEAGYAIGAPGATLGAALAASDRAEVAWNATVSVRNEVVSAYQSIMNMQF